MMDSSTILLIKATVTQNEVAHSYYRVRGLYLLAAVFAATIYVITHLKPMLFMILVHVHDELTFIFVHPKETATSYYNGK